MWSQSHSSQFTQSSPHPPVIVHPSAPTDLGTTPFAALGLSNFRAATPRSRLPAAMLRELFSEFSEMEIELYGGWLGEARGARAYA